MALTGADARHLRALAHQLDPIVQLGKEGITDALVAATSRALLDHELIKVKILSEAPVDRHEAAEQLAAATDADVAQVIGRIVILYRPHPEEPTIRLPNAGVGGRAASKPQAKAGAKKAKKKSGVGARPKHKRRTLGRGGRPPKARPAKKATNLAPRPKREGEERGEERSRGADRREKRPMRPGEEPERTGRRGARAR
jgi:RNA-binding protein